MVLCIIGYFFVGVILLNTADAKSVIVRTVSDCMLDENGIIHYKGNHSYTKFNRVCLHWSDFMRTHEHIVNDATFMYDRSVSDAHNFCRNPDLRDDSPWCFVERNPPRTEPCFVCNSLKERPTGVLPDLDHGSPGGFFEGFRYNMERLRQKFVDFMKKMGEKMERITARILERFGFNVRNVE